MNPQSPAPLLALISAIRAQKSLLVDQGDELNVYWPDQVDPLLDELDDAIKSDTRTRPATELPELPEPSFQLNFRQGNYYVTKPNIGQTDCYNADQMRAYANGHAAYWYEMWRNRRDAYNELLAAKGGGESLLRRTMMLSDNAQTSLDRIIAAIGREEAK